MARLSVVLPTGFIQELLTRVDVVEVVGRHVELKRAGTVHKGLCPFHGEKTPELHRQPEPADAITASAAARMAMRSAS